MPAEILAANAHAKYPASHACPWATRLGLEKSFIETHNLYAISYSVRQGLCESASFYLAVSVEIFRVGVLFFVGVSSAAVVVIVAVCCFHTPNICSEKILVKVLPMALLSFPYNFHPARTHSPF